MAKEFYAGVWLGIQNFDTAVANVPKITDIICNAATLKECKEDIEQAVKDFDPTITGRRFAIIKVAFIEEVDHSLKEEA